ncbi:MAG: long-chain fatty acid--CoA ligase [Pyrinomonadaceae bacterium]|nr:long-chain fatty acid--CoA ligase [Pyrinomonadaceae bacterium]
MDVANIGQLLKDRVSHYREKPFLFSEADGREWTYAEFDAAVNRSANMLLQHGIQKGDVVSLLLPNSAEYIIAYFACWKIGALAGPVNSLLKSEEIEWIVSNSESKLILIGDEGAIPTRIEGVGRTPSILFGNVDIATEGFSDELDETEITENDEAIIIYTSGTTGKPKGCLLTHGNLIANARQITEWLGFGPDDRLLSVMPLFHMNAVSVTTVSALYAGGSTVVSPKFSASRFWDIIEKYRITSFGSVATMLSMLLNVSSEQRAMSSTDRKPLTAHGSPLTSLRFAMCGSAPVPSEVLKRFEETFGVLVIEGYGLSESTCRSTFNPPNQNRRPGSCGMPIGNEMRVVDDEDSDVPDGTLGEIVLRGPNIFKGYFKNPEATAKAFAGGWFHTGDIGYRDADGFYYIADRKSDMIIRGGENIYPREIDDLLYTHPAVAHAAVIGVPDELYGEEVAAFIVLKAETRPVGSVPGEPQVTAQDIIDFCQLHLADYKCPKTVHFVDDIPKGPTGKLLKRELAKRFSKA